MNTSVRDALLRKVGKIGKSGRLPLPDPKTTLALQEMQTSLDTLADTSAKLLQHAGDAPIFDPTGNLFLIDCRAGGNILTTTQATRNGLPAYTGFCIYRHGKGYALNRYTTVFWTLDTPAATQPIRVGGFMVYGYDNERTVFQVDDDAQTQAAVGIVSCFSSFKVPGPSVGAANPGRIQGGALFLAEDTTLEGP